LFQIVKPLLEDVKMILITHKACSGPAIEANSLEAETRVFMDEEFPLTCFTCLDDIIDRSEMRVGEQFRM
jgi:hypothetical protein